MNFHGREWLPIPEAAKYLSEKAKETWKEQHVYSAVLDRRLPLVARLFSGTKDLLGKEVDGLVNVPIKGGAKQYLEYLEHSFHEPVHYADYVKIDGAVVERDGEEYYLGQVPGEHSVFPTGTQLGVRVEALEAFIKQPLADARDKPLRPNEREKLLTIIYALIKENAKDPIDLSEPVKAAQTIESMADLAGVTVSAKTIQRRLEEIVESIVPRDKTSD